MRLDDSSAEVKIDEKDRKIILLLVENGRMPATEIAKKVMLSKDAVSYRIKKLQEHGLIKKFTVIADYKAFGFSAYEVLLQTREVTAEKEEKFLKYLDKEPQIVDVIDYSDIADFKLKIIARSMEEFDKILTWIKKEFVDLIEHMTVMPVVEEIENLLLPLEIGESIEIKKAKEIKLDEKDIKIIKLLSENCRLSSYDIADKVGINADTVIYRIKNMLASNAIRFTTLINLSTMGYEGYALLLRLRATGIEEEKIKSFIKENKNLLVAERCVGEWDLILHFVTKDAREFHGIIKRIRKEFGGIILDYNTLMVYSEHEFDYASFLDVK